MTSKRTTFKLSMDLTDEQARQAIAAVMNIPVEQLSHISLSPRLTEMKDERKLLEDIISDYRKNAEKDRLLPKDKLEELYDVGRFILKYNAKFKLSPPDRNLKFPDFILQYQDIRIALEHTRLLSEVQQRTFKTARYIIGEAERLVRAEVIKVSKTINIFLNTKEELSVKDAYSMAEELADYVTALLTNNISEQPAFVSQITSVDNPDNRLDLVLAESYFTNGKLSDALLTRIDAKEKKAGNYRNAGNFNQLWLLVAMDDINSPSGCFLDTNTLPKIPSSGFDVIFLFEKYLGKLILLYSKAANGITVSPHH